MYTIKWTGPEPKEDGWSPPSDTNFLRLLQPDFGEEHVEPGSTGHSHLQMVAEDRDPLDQLLDQDPALLVVCGLPDDLDVQISQHGRNGLETVSQGIPRAFRQVLLGNLIADRLDGASKAPLLFLEEVGADPVLVVKAQQLPTLVRERPQGVAGSAAAS